MTRLRKTRRFQIHLSFHYFHRHIEFSPQRSFVNRGDVRLCQHLLEHDLVRLDRPHPSQKTQILLRGSDLSLRPSQTIHQFVLSCFVIFYGRDE